MRGGLRRRRQGDLPSFPRLHQAARHVRQFRLSIRTDRCLQYQHSADQRIAVRHPPDAQHLRRQARGLAQDRERPVRRGGARRGQDPGEPEISAERRAEGTPRSRKPPYHGIEHSAAVIGGTPRSWLTQPINPATRAKAAWSSAPGARRGIPTTSIASANRSTVATVSSSDAALPSLSLTTTAAMSRLRRAMTSSADKVWLMVPT